MKKLSIALLLLLPLSVSAVEQMTSEELNKEHERIMAELEALKKHYDERIELMTAFSKANNII